MRCPREHLLHTRCHCFPFIFLMSPHCHPLTLHQLTLTCFLVLFLIMPHCFSCFSWIRHFKTTSFCHILLSGVLAICMPAEVHTQRHFHLYAKIVRTLDCTYTAAHRPDTHMHPHTQPKRPFKAVSSSICPFPSKWVENGGAGAK